VGTTSVRALESAAAAVERGAPDCPAAPLAPYRGWTDLFVTPGYRFRVIDGLITNFHLPRSTLLLLVSALVGRERLLAAYVEAIRLRYRFYSFGDAMLIL
jgi:S-adenosylmethionine:tRNA ribosyltransferase-isomerase